MPRIQALREDGSAPTRRTAIAHGLTRYFTGKFCRYGHMAQRYASTGACVVCLANHASAAEGRRTEAEELLRLGMLSKQSAINLHSPFYCTGKQLDCGHIAHQLVIDDSCRMCNKKRVDLIEELLS